MEKKSLQGALVTIKRSKEALSKFDIEKRLKYLHLNEVKDKKSQRKGPIIYWMSREQRAQDNWALLYALQRANEQKQPLVVVFNLLKSYLKTNQDGRHFQFMLQGLKELQENLQSQFNIPMAFLENDENPGHAVFNFSEKIQAGLIVTDFSPLRTGIEWKQKLVEKLKQNNGIEVHQIDAHNIVPVWEASKQQEFMAKTIRPKITNQLYKYLEEFPELEKPKIDWAPKQFEEFQQHYTLNWDNVILKNQSIYQVLNAFNQDISFKSGEKAGIEALVGEKGFLTKNRLKLYAEKRNDPSTPQALSNISPYLHYGMLAPQRAALEASKLKSSYKDSVESFFEELVIRRELSDNYCFYNKNYDKFEGALKWAQDTLKEHASDKRPYLYTLEELENSKTHDNLWNAAQIEMVVTGKMHGYIRMYWAKKILEWSKNPQDALEYSIYLNDKYSLDGRDPNGFVGCQWSICGIHDRGWTERAIFGKIRFMNYDGCKRKFSIPSYVERIRVIQSKNKDLYKHLIGEQKNKQNKKEKKIQEQQEKEEDSKQESESLKKSMKVKVNESQDKARKKQRSTTLNKKRNI